MGTPTSSTSLPFASGADDLHDAVFVLTLAGDIVWANRAAAGFVGRSSESLMGIRLAEILTPRSAELAEIVLRNAYTQTGAQPVFELEFVRKDLMACRREFDFSRLSGTNSQTLVAIGRDTSQRSFIEQEKRRAEFQTLQFQAALVELSRSDSSTLEERLAHITAVGAAALDVGRLSVWLFNDSHTELRCIDLFDRERGTHASGAILEVGRYPVYFAALENQRTIAAHHARTDPLTAEFADDYLPTWNIVSMLDVPIRREGQLVGVLCHEHIAIPRQWKLDEQNFAASLADLTALVLETQRRREAEHELRKSYDRLEVFFSQSLDGFFFMMLDSPVRWDETVDKDMTLDYVFTHQRVVKTNDAMLLQYGASRDTFIGLTPRDFFGHDLPHGRDLWRRMFDAGRLHVESDERRLDGNQIWIEGDYICLYETDGRITGHFGIQRDITERKMAEKAERDRAEAALRDSEERNVYLREELQSEWNFEEIVGASAVMQKAFSSIEMVAVTDSTVLLLGETGTGKELIARAVHNRSRRRANVMVKVNCGALPSNLVESELFGHEKGAFTGAIAQKKGRFELAHQGTIFLDEVGELPLDIQTKLLRVLQEQEFERVGGSRSLKVDVRVIAATNRNLVEEVRRGAFRVDLFYRLNVFPIEVPPLRQRREDVPLLASYFVTRFSQRMGKRIVTINRSVLDRMQRYDWPGNVRELANVMERAVILCQGDALQEGHISLGSRPAATSAPDKFPSLEDAERGAILQALERTSGVLAGPNGAAQLLGINRSTLWSRMKKLGIELSQLKKL